MTTKAKDIPNEEFPDGGLVWIQWWTRAPNATGDRGTVKVSFAGVEGNAHEGVGKIQDQDVGVETQQARREEGIAVVDVPG